MGKISIDPELCTKCGTCVQNCPAGIFKQDDDDYIPKVEGEDNCILCGECVDNCPANAVKHKNFL
jgi:NAD-dependent dihydropyrimidine dehydrogenase PreA subunit